MFKHQKLDQMIEEMINDLEITVSKFLIPKDNNKYMKWENAGEGRNLELLVYLTHAALKLFHISKVLFNWKQKQAAKAKNPIV